MENLIAKHQELFKSNDKTYLQEKRRQLLLKEQKIKRSLIQDEYRNLHETLKDAVRTKYRNKTRTFKEKYGIDHKLQLSEWMKEKPEELTEWILVPCPKGVRCMVIACHGRTEVYTKSGKLYKTLKSLLPGNVGCKSDVTILDCIYVNKAATFYVLDTISYGNQDMHYCEAQFRFFWLTSKLLELPLDEISRSNDCKFICLEHYDFANSDSVINAFQQYPVWTDNFPEVDGYLFYHKEASYTCGTTPLVGWLFPFMVPEVLGFPVHDAYMKQMPENYIDYLHYIVEFDEMMTKKHMQRKAKNAQKTKMDEDVYTRKEMDEDEDDNLKLVLESQRCLELSGDTEYIDET